MSRLNNISSEQFPVLRSAAEAEAQAIMKARHAAIRAAEAEAQGILAARNTATRLANEAKRRAQAHAKAKAEAERIRTEAEAKKAEAAKAKAEAETREEETILRQSQMEADEKAKESTAFIRMGIGFLKICIAFLAISLVSSYIRSCLAEHFFPNVDKEETDIDDDDSSISDYDISSIDHSNAKEKLERIYDDVFEFKQYFEIGKNGRCGIADLNGNVKIEPKYDNIYSSLDDDLGVVEVLKDDKYGLVSLKTFTEIVEPKYDFMYYVSEAKAIEIQIDSKYGLLSSEDFSVIVEPIYDYIGSFNEETGLYEVGKNSQYGLFNPSKKKEVTPCIFKDINYEGGLYEVYLDGKTDHLNKDGSVLKKPE